MKRNFIPIIAAGACVIILLGMSSNLFQDNRPDMSGGPPGLIVEEASMQEMLEAARIRNISIYLPSNLPNSLTLTTVYIQESPFHVIIPFSSDGNKNYDTAEIYLGISKSEPPTYSEMQTWAEDNENASAVLLGSWMIYMNEYAYIGNEERREKYGNYHFTAAAYKENIKYVFLLPTLTMEEYLAMMQTMTLHMGVKI